MVARSNSSLDRNKVIRLGTCRPCLKICSTSSGAKHNRRDLGGKNQLPGPTSQEQQNLEQQNNLKRCVKFLDMFPQLNAFSSVKSGQVWTIFQKQFKWKNFWKTSVIPKRNGRRRWQRWAAPQLQRICHLGWACPEQARPGTSQEVKKGPFPERIKNI